MSFQVTLTATAVKERKRIDSILRLVSSHKGNAQLPRQAIKL